MKRHLAFLLTGLLCIWLVWVFIERGANGNSRVVIELPSSNEMHLEQTVHTDLPHEFDIGNLVAFDAGKPVSLVFDVVNHDEGEEQFDLHSKSCGCLNLPKELKLLCGVPTSVRVEIAANSIDEFVHSFLFKSKDGDGQLAVAFKGRILPKAFPVMLSANKETYWEPIDGLVFTLDSKGMSTNQAGLVLAADLDKIEIEAGDLGFKVISESQIPLQADEISLEVVPFSIQSNSKELFSDANNLRSFVTVNNTTRIPIQITQVDSVRVLPSKSIFIADTGPYEVAEIELRSQNEFAVTSIEFDNSMLLVKEKESPLRFSKVFNIRLRAAVSRISKFEIHFNLDHPDQIKKVVKVYCGQGNLK